VITGHFVRRAAEADDRGVRGIPPATSIQQGVARESCRRLTPIRRAQSRRASTAFNRCSGDIMRTRVLDETPERQGISVVAEGVAISLVHAAIADKRAEGW
jgi:hypothetical protein